MFLHAGRTRLLVGATTILFFHSCQVVWTTSNENQTHFENQPQRCVTTNDNWQILKILHNENNFKDPLWQEQLWKSSMTRTIFKIRHNNNFKDPLWQQQFWKSATTTILKIRHNNNFENPPPGLSFHLTWAVFVVSVRSTSSQGSKVLFTFSSSYLDTTLNVGSGGCQKTGNFLLAPFQPVYQSINPPLSGMWQ